MKGPSSLTAPVPLLCALTLLLAWDATGLGRLSLLCALLHELGHIAAFWVFTHKKPQLQFSLNGITLKLDGARLSLRQEDLLLLAGPAANLLAALACGLLLRRRAGHLLYFFCCENLCMALFNLLPIGFLDGGRLLRNRFGPGEDRLFCLLSLAGSFFLAVFGAVALRYQGARFARILAFCLMVLALCAKSMGQ